MTYRRQCDVSETGDSVTFGDSVMFGDSVTFWRQCDVLETV